jgi:NAD/NADP transhydrogenase beta subunit
MAIEILQILYIAAALMVVIGQLHCLLRTGRKGFESTGAGMTAAVSGLVLCERHLRDSGDILLTASVALLLSLSACIAWRARLRQPRQEV